MKTFRLLFILCSCCSVLTFNVPELHAKPFCSLTAKAQQQCRPIPAQSLLEAYTFLNRLPPAKRKQLLSKSMELYNRLSPKERTASTMNAMRIHDEFFALPDHQRNAMREKIFQAVNRLDLHHITLANIHPPSVTSLDRFYHTLLGIARIQ